MKTIGSKKEMQALADALISMYRRSGEKAFLQQLHETVLQRKVRFPILEFLTEQLFAEIPFEKQLSVTDKIVTLAEIGSYVIAGKMLQLRLEEDFSTSVKKACDYFMQGDEWYVCDIIGERVFGVALLHTPAKTLPVLRKNAVHPDQWVVRSVGVATHYAVKKGLAKPYVEEMLQLLLTLSGATGFHTKRGVGWGAKTIAKFYPDLIRKNAAAIEAANPGTWFRSKIAIGLGRSSKYASRYAE